MSNTRKIKPPRQARPGRGHAAAAITLAMIRGYRTGDQTQAEAVRMIARADSAVVGTVVAMLAAVAAGLTTEVTDSELERAITAAWMRGMMRPPPKDQP